MQAGDFSRDELEAALPSHTGESNAAILVSVRGRLWKKVRPVVSAYSPVGEIVPVSTPPFAVW
jgi:hypothetical protein